MQKINGLVPGDQILANGGGIVLYKNKPYMAVLFNPQDGYCLKPINPKNQLEAEAFVWAKEKDVILKLN
jgi:hypothetical protein